MTNGFTNNDGFSLIEALAAIVIIGITTTAVLFFINKFLGTSRINPRMEAISMIQNEIQNTIAARSVSDTIYSNKDRHLKLFKRVTDLTTYYQIDLYVLTNNNIELANIPIAIKK